MPAVNGSDGIDQIESTVIHIMQGVLLLQRQGYQATRVYS